MIVPFVGAQHPMGTSIRPSHIDPRDRPDTIPQQAQKLTSKGRLEVFDVLMCVLVVITTLALPFKDGKSVCSALTHLEIREIPAALDLLATRYSLKVGVVRALLNSEGGMDRFVQAYFESFQQNQQLGTLNCYLLYYNWTFHSDELQKTEANALEEALSLKSPPTDPQ